MSNELSQKLLTLIEEFILNEKLDAEIIAQFPRFYLPLAGWLAEKHRNRTIVIGINGAQGSGKTTLSKILKLLLTQVYKKSVISFSIDDLYLSKTRREILAKEIHPLFITRGVPGTHDIKLGQQIFKTLLNPLPGSKIKLPVFNKSEDDLLPKADWITVNNKADIILFEGWCVGAKAEQPEQLKEAINELEKNEDPNLIWRNYINQQLSEIYPSLFNFINYQIMLNVPDMESVFEWRHLQELKLMNKKSSLRVMSKTELKRFIMHFERITRSMLKNMPSEAHAVIHLNKQHQVSDVVINDKTTALS